MVLICLVKDCDTQPTVTYEIGFQSGFHFQRGVRSKFYMGQATILAKKSSIFELIYISSK